MTVMTVNGITAGIEIELFHPVILGRERSPEGFSFASDASIQSPMKYHQTTGLCFPEGGDSDKIFRLVPYQSVVGGTELVSRILDTENEERQIKEMLNSVSEFGISRGENPLGNSRCGIHFHISASGVSLKFLKNLVNLFTNMEDIIYTISGMGTIFRGEENNSAYARPLTGNGIFVPYRDVWAELISLKNLKNAQTLNEFFTMWGDSITQSRTHYFPVRYYGLNLAAVLYKRTVEFRTNNTCLNPDWIFSSLEFYRKMVEMSLVVSTIKGKKILEMEENSAYSPRSTAQMIFGLEKFWKECEGDDKTFYHLENILRQTKPPQLDKRPIRSHLARRGRILPHWDGESYQPEKYLSSGEVSLPNFTDLHVLRGD